MISLAMSSDAYQAPDQHIEQFISSFAEHQPPFSSLGTPFLVDTEATNALVAIGTAAVPALTAALAANNPKIAMYAAYCLGHIGDTSVLPALRQIVDHYAAKEPKEEYDFAVISAANQAITQFVGLNP